VFTFSFFSFPIQSQQKEADEDKERKRQVRWVKILEELVETERKYIHDLRLIKEIFVTPLQRSIESQGTSRC
jgi:hypothetical protein